MLPRNDKRKAFLGDNGIPGPSKAFRIATWCRRPALGAPWPVPPMARLTGWIITAFPPVAPCGPIPRVKHNR